MADFWAKIESDTIQIPNFIKNGFELCGYANALVFKNITDADIDLVENFIKSEVLTYLSKSTADAMNESDRSGFVEHDDVLVDSEQLIDHFGKLYAAQPEKFRFQPGDRVLIKTLVTEVKSIVDGKGINTGLRDFQPKKRMKVINKANKHQAVEKLALDNVNNTNLKSDLIQRVKTCMYSHRVNSVFDIDLENAINDDNVSVYTKNGVVYGTVRCIICDEQKKGKNKPKRIHYSSGSNWPCWVLSNFAKHLKQIHRLKSDTIEEMKQEEELVDQESYCSPNTKTELVEHQEKNVSTVSSNNSVVCLEDSAQFESHYTEHMAIANNVYTQLSTQITAIMSMCLKLSERQEKMQFQLNNNALKSLTIAKIPADGSCLFGALTHQLATGRINGKTHQAATTKLRQEVVKYILDETNYPKFAHQLRDRVYDFKNTEDIEDIDSECKLFVEAHLSQNECWGGTETIHAVSEMKNVNIVLFYENGPCHMPIGFNDEYERTLCIAYRQAKGADGKIVAGKIRNHFDSVCDVSSDVLYDVAQLIAKKK